MVITAIQEKQGIIASYKRASETFKKIKNNTIDSLSMGMSSDYIEALKLGSNMIRLGTIILAREMLDRRLYIIGGGIWVLQLQKGF